MQKRQMGWMRVQDEVVMIYTGIDHHQWIGVVHDQRAHC